MGNSEEKSLGRQIDLDIIIHPEAKLEVQETFDYYEQKSKGLGLEFMRSLDAVIQSIKRNPLAYQKIHKEARRVLLRKFPYAVFYVAETNRITVIACFHQRRGEIDWLRRS